MLPKSKPEPLRHGVIAIAANGELQMKLCWKTPGSIEVLVHALRDQCIVDPDAVFQKAVLLGFEDLLLLTPTSRIASNGDVEPDKPDTGREKFSDTEWTPFGRCKSLFMDMTGEFAAVERMAKRK